MWGFLIPTKTKIRKEVSDYEKQKNRENRDKKSMGKLLGQEIQGKKRVSEQTVKLKRLWLPQHSLKKNKKVIDNMLQI